MFQNANHEYADTVEDKSDWQATFVATMKAWNEIDQQKYVRSLVDEQIPSHVSTPRSTPTVLSPREKPVLRPPPPPVPPTATQRVEGEAWLGTDAGKRWS